MVFFSQKKIFICIVMESNNYIINYMTSHVMDLTWLGWFGIITYLKVNLSFIIHHLTYLTFSTNSFNQFIFNSQYHELMAYYFLRQTYIGRYILTYWDMYNLVNELSCRSLTGWVIGYIILEHP